MGDLLQTDFQGFVEKNNGHELSIGPSRKDWIHDKINNDILKETYLRDGVAVLKNVFNYDQIKQYNKIVKSERASCEDGKNEYGFGDRIGQLHQKYPDLLKMADNKNIINFLKWAFDDTPIVFGSLNFDRGTQQGVHKDGIFFWPEPHYSMAGVWVALEDINEDSGPLFYIPGSHKWPFYFSEDVISLDPELEKVRINAVNASPEERALCTSKVGSLWGNVLRAQEKKMNGERVTFNLKAGDVVIWHPLLAHGGSPVNNPKLSRKSVVFHFISKNTKLYTHEQFMLHRNSDLKSLSHQELNLNKFGDLEYMQYGYYVTYPLSGQKVYTL